MFNPEKSKTFLFVFIMIWFIIGWFFIVAPLAQVKSFFAKAPEFINTKFLNKIPSDLAVTINNGQVSINKPSPYCLIIDDQKRGVVFDIKSNSSPNPQDLEPKGKYSSLCTPLAIIGQEYVLYPDKDSSYKVTKISSDINYTATKNSAETFVSQVLPRLLSFGWIVYFAAPFFSGPLVFVYFLLLNTWYAWFVKFISKIVKIKTSVPSDKIYNLTLFFFTFILVIDWVFFGYLLPLVVGNDNINANFFMRNTIFITLLSLYYFYSHPLTDQSPTPPGNDPTRTPQLK